MLRYYALIMLSFMVMGTSLGAEEKSLDELIAIVYKSYNEGEYEQTIEDLEALSKTIPKIIKRKKEIQGLVEYWRGLTYSKLNEYDLAILHFKKALSYDYSTQEMYYEIAQAYYVSDKLLDAMSMFRYSVKKGYKRGVSLYYMASISQQLNDLKKAVAYFNAIEKINSDEQAEVIQAARMQIGDIYLSKIELLPNSFKKIENIVIPQYKFALDWNEDSELAAEIKEKIKSLQQKYDLVMFKMRNGRPTANPPFFLKANILYGTDSNVAYQSNETVQTAQAEEVASPYASFGTFGRYSYYPNSYISIAPEFLFNYTKYLSTNETIFAYDNYSYSFGLKTTYEHIYNESAATLYLDIQVLNNYDDSNADKKLEGAYKLTSYTLSEEVQFWRNNPTIFRLRISKLDHEVESSSSNITSLLFEQLVGFSFMTIYSYNSLDMTRYPEYDAADTNAMLNRVDLIFGNVLLGLNPSIFVANTFTKYINDDDRDSSTNFQYGINIRKQFNSRTSVYVDYNTSTQTGKSETDNYKKDLISVNLDYFY